MLRMRFSLCSAFLFLVFAAVAGCGAATADEVIASSDQGLTSRLHCASFDHHYHRCDVPTADGDVVDVRVVHEVAGAHCEAGRTYGFGSDYVWVDDGCRGDFEVSLRRTETERIRCSSLGDHYQRCDTQLRLITSVRLVRQLSSAICEEGRTFGFHDDNVWVDQGCRGDFEARGFAEPR